jgi:hypothetical protein
VIARSIESQIAKSTGNWSALDSGLDAIISDGVPSTKSLTFLLNGSYKEVNMSEIRHMANCTNNNRRLARFYRLILGMEEVWNEEQNSPYAFYVPMVIST